MHSFIKCFKSKKADSDYTPLFVEELNKVRLGLIERLNEAKEDEEVMKKQMERDMPYGHKYDESEANIHILQKEDVPAPAVEVEPLVDGMDKAALEADWRPLAIALGIVATCQVIGTLEVLLIVCIAVGVFWTMPKWLEAFLTCSLKATFQGAQVQTAEAIEGNPHHQNAPEMQDPENVT